MVPIRQRRVVAVVSSVLLGVFVGCGVPGPDDGGGGVDPSTTTDPQSSASPFLPGPEVAKPVLSTVAMAHLVPPQKATGPRQPSGQWPAIQTSVPLYELTVSQA